MTFKKDKLPWKVGHVSSPETGPLTNEQVKHLSEKYGFSSAKIRQLARDISSVLREDLRLSQPEFKQGLSNSGAQELQRAIKDLEKAVKQLNRASAAIDKIKFPNSLARIGGSNPALIQLENFAAGKARIEDFLKFLDVVERTRQPDYVETGELGFSVRHVEVNRRSLKDVRREILVTNVFNFWDCNDRRLTYTTDPDTSERSGELFSFVNDVVTCLTEPPTPIDTDTLKKDLDAFKQSSSLKR